MDFQIRTALRSDAESLAQLINCAGEGIPKLIWSELAQNGQSPMAVGVERAGRPEGAFSYLNAMVAVRDQSTAGMLIAYPLPKPYFVGEISEYPELIRPLILLEAQAAGCWYINGIAVFQNFRRQGVAQALMENTFRDAKARHYSTVSLIVSVHNTGAVKLYKSLGFEVAATQACFPHPKLPTHGNWQLMKADT